MTAKEQVLKVYPDAVHDWEYNVQGNHSITYYVKSGSERISDRSQTIQSAWQSALTKINENNETRTKDNSTVL